MKQDYKSVLNDEEEECSSSSSLQVMKILGAIPKTFHKKCAQEIYKNSEMKLMDSSKVKRLNTIPIYQGRRRQTQTVLLTFYVWSVLISVVIMAPVGASIDCFKCVSLNGNNPSCEDPFHNNFSSSILESPCMGGRKGRNGLFPATACIKLIGKYYDNGQTLVIRGCSLDSNTLTTDTELIRMSHCGGFEFEDRYIKGCVQSCQDADGCNFSTRPNPSCFTLLIITSLFTIITFYRHRWIYYNFPVLNF